MKSSRIRILVFLAVAGLVRLAAVSASREAAADAEKYWAQWRGPYATGVSEQADPPVEWSETKNIRWRVEIPGRGSASPIVWGDKIFLLTAVPVNSSGDDSHKPKGGIQPRQVHRYMVLAIDRKTGKTIWERVAREEAPHEASHQDNGTWASSSASTDGERVYAWFESRGMFVYDLNGKLIWQKDLGKKNMRNQFGEGSTPALYGNRIIIVWDHIVGPSFITVLDKLTGQEIWRVGRDEIDTWATPLVIEHEGRAQIIVPGMKRLLSYDLETGKIVWQSKGLTMNPIPSPVYSDGMVFATSGFQGNNLKAVRLAEAKGDITGTGAIVWSLDRDTPYVPSPLLYNGILYILKTNNGLLSAFEAKTGKPHFQLQRLEGVPNVFSSPVGAKNRVYITGREGTTLVIKNAPAFEILAKNTLDDGFDASPALVDKEILLRGYKYLYSIAAP